MTYDELQEINEQMRRCRIAAKRSPETLNELEKLNRLITRIANEQTAKSADMSRNLRSIENSIARIRELPMAKRQAG